MDGQKITVELLAQAERLERDWSSMAELLRGAAVEITQYERRIAGLEKALEGYRVQRRGKE